MTRQDNRRRLGAFVFASVLAVAAYQTSVFGVLFLLPLEWVRQRQGERSFVVGAIVVIVGIGVVQAAIKSVLHSSWTLLDTFGLGLPLLLTVGWASIVMLGRFRWRFLFRLLAVTAGTGVVLFPLFSNLLGQASLVQAVQKSFDEVWGQVFQTPGMDVPGLMGSLDKTEFFELMKETFLGSFLLVFFLFWGLTAWMGRSFGPNRGRQVWKDFFVPSQGAWILLGLWGLILVQGLLLRVGVRWDWGFFQYVVFNAAWLALVVHAMAGWGILHALMDRWQWPRIAQGAVRVSAVFLLFVPGPAQGIVLVGLPVLAVLELWVNFRKRTQGVGV